MASNYDHYADELVDLIERLESHMGKQDPQILLADCREAASELRAQSVQIAKLQADGERLAEALEAFQRHYDLNDCDERCGALEVPISDLRRARQALAAKGDSRG